MLEVVSAVGGDHRLDLCRIVGPVPELDRQRRAEALHPDLVRRLEPAVRAHRVAVRAQDQLDRVDEGAVQVEQEGGDRKSTRLNSSHGYISYAVFCLKKKKKEKTEETPSGLRRHLHA